MNIRKNLFRLLLAVLVLGPTVFFAYYDNADGKSQPKLETVTLTEDMVVRIGNFPSAKNSDSSFSYRSTCVLRKGGTLSRTVLAKTPEWVVVTYTFATPTRGPDCPHDGAWTQIPFKEFVRFRS